MKLTKKKTPYGFTALLTKGPVVTEFYHKAEPLNVSYADRKLKTMTENERDHIIAILKRCNWKVYGLGGAAELLEMNVSTLNSRIKKLGIEKGPVDNKSNNATKDYNN